MSTSPPLRRESYAILAALLGVSLASWAVLVWQSQHMSTEMADPGMSMVSSLTAGMGGVLFLTMWVLMMVAMMFPTAAPMVLMFHRISTTKRSRGEAFVPTWLFVAGYLIIWTLFGVVAFAAATALDSLGARVMVFQENAARFGGAVLALAGLYQLSPLKKVCLTKCRSPLAFVTTSWRDGRGGALRMGVQHGVYCLGCCWLLFVLLFPLGVMNVAAMGLVTLLIFAEKSVRHGMWVGRAVGVGLIALGAVIMVMPNLLPTNV